MSVNNPEELWAETGDVSAWGSVPDTPEGIDDNPVTTMEASPDLQAVTHVGATATRKLLLPVGAQESGGELYLG